MRSALLVLALTACGLQSRNPSDAGEVRSAHAVPPDDLYFGGQVSGSGEIAAIIRLRRQ